MKIMRNRAKFGLPVLVTLMLSLVGCAGTQSSPQASAQPETAAPSNATPVTGIAAETVITVHGRIVAVDSASHQVPFQGPAATTTTLSLTNPSNLRPLKHAHRSQP